MIEDIKALFGWFSSLYDGAVNVGNAIRNWGSGGAGKAPASLGANAPAGVAPPISGQRAKGGDVFAGRSYLVGEERPEIFTPTRNGSIDPNTGGGKAAPNMTINAVFNLAGIQNPEHFFREIKRRFEVDIRREMNGIYADL